MARAISQYSKRLRAVKALKESCGAARALVQAVSVPSPLPAPQTHPHGCRATLARCNQRAAMSARKPS